MSSTELDPVALQVITGAQVLELDGSTAWVPTGWAGDTDPHGTLILRRTS